MKTIKRAKKPTDGTPPPFDHTFNGTRCGAKLRNKERHCKLYAGYKTPHVGNGRCWLHGGLTPIKNGRYSCINHTRVRALMDKLDETDRNVLDLEPEAQLARAMLINFVSNYEDFVEKLDAWYDYRQEQQNSKAEGGKGGPPVPRHIPDLEEAIRIVEAISRVVERIHKIQKEGSIDLATFRRVMEQMGMVVAKHVTQPKILKKIEHDWGNCVVDAKSFTTDNNELGDAATDDPEDDADDET